MQTEDLAFIALAVNPVGGLALAIPFAVFKLRYPAWFAVAAGVPLAYLQVVAVDLAWSLLIQAAWWRDLLARHRSPWDERLVASRGGFWITFLAGPLIGPWLVMAFMRYSLVPQRRVALPIVLGVTCFAAILAAGCVWLPRVFSP